MKRENELLLKEFKKEVKEILQDFNDVINAKLGETVTITSSTGTIARPTNLQDKIDLYQDEWCKTLDSLIEIGINIGYEEEQPIEINKHYRIYEELKQYMDNQNNENKIANFQYHNIQAAYKGITLGEDNGVDYITLYGDVECNNPIMIIRLLNDSEYEATVKTGEDYHALLIKK